MFTAATTVVCATAGNYTGAPAHDAANRTTTLDAALARLKALKAGGQLCRLLFRAGDQFSMTINNHMGSLYRNLYVSSFGTGRATIRATKNGSIFDIQASLPVSGASISRLAFTGPWDSTTETRDPAYAAIATGEAVGVSFNGGFSTVHDCTGTGLWQAYYVGGASGLTAIVSDCQATNWEDYGMYVSGEILALPTDPMTGYIGILGCRFHQDANALQGGNGKSRAAGELGNRHGALRMHSQGYHHVDALDGFSRNGWTLVGTLDGSNVPADQNVIRDHRNHPKSRGFFSRIMGEGGWQGYSNGSSSPDQTGEGGFHRPCNTVLDKAYFLGSARTIGFLGISASAFTGRNIILHRPNVGTGADSPDGAIEVGTGDPGDFSEAVKTEPVRLYNVTVVNEMDNIQQARNNRNNSAWSPVDIRPNCYNDGMVRVENLVVHRPNFTGGTVADATLDNARLGLVPRYLGYRWRRHLMASGTVMTLDKLVMDTSFATPANPWSLWRPQAGSPAIGSATGDLVAHDDLLGRVRPAQAARGAIEPAA